jgi:regulator of RNase E activity RraA
MKPSHKRYAPTVLKKAIHLFLQTPTPIIADAMDGRNVLACLQPIISNNNVSGPLVTVKTNPTDWGTVVAGIEEASPGDVLFIDSAASNVAVWGGLTSQAAQQRGLLGTIVHGSCRDVPTIEALRYPVWAKGVTARAGKPLNRGKVNVPITVGGLSIRPHDLAKADVHGVVIIPAQEVGMVAKKVVEIVKKERFIEAGIKRGQTLSELLSDFSS